MKPRDAIVTFQCFPPDLVQVSETKNGENTSHMHVLRHPDVVAEMEKKYIFFAEQANIARKQIMKGESCVFNVYFREP
jgi:hypothetical protein